MSLTNRGNTPQSRKAEKRKKMSNTENTVRRVDSENVEAEGLITLAECAEAAGVTKLTATKRLTAVGLLGPGVEPVAYESTGVAGRPPRLFPRVEALEVVLNGVGNRRAQGEKDPSEFEAAPAASEADEALAAIAAAEAEAAEPEVDADAVPPASAPEAETVSVGEASEASADEVAEQPAA